jgi:prophage maintenance system killer protein
MRLASGTRRLSLLPVPQPCLRGWQRTALGACLVFLEANGLLSNPAHPERHIDDWERLVLDVAASLLDREQTTAGLRKLLQG